VHGGGRSRKVHGGRESGFHIFGRGVGAAKLAGGRSRKVHGGRESGFVFGA
jgi:hypothetical protein